jgi:RNA polymerase sigma-70 factor, ECF subfamily
VLDINFKERMDQQLEHIIQGCKKGNADSQKQLYQYCYETMMRVCQRYHTNEQDAVNGYNEAMYTVLSKINQYKNEGEFMGWVRRIMVNTSLNIIKREKKFVYKEVAETDTQRFSIQPDVYSNMNTQKILSFVQELPRQTALIFNLYIMEGYTHEQIGGILGISGNTSKWHLNNARTILKEKLINSNANESCKNA